MLESTFLRDAKAFPSDFAGIKISLASPETIKSWSYGEVTKPETINYRTFKPEPDGLFCERIFGPVRDWECSCGKYKRIRYRGVRCDRCGVEVTHSKVRRDRMGHIELAVPVTHIWYFKSRKISKILDIKNLDLERVIYYESYIVTESEHPSITPGTVLSEDDLREAKETFGDVFKFKMGAEAIFGLLEKLDLDELAASLRTSIANETTATRRAKNIKRLKEIEALRLSKNDNRPEWMILRILPVLPPDLRPLVPLEGGRFATSDLNDLYRRVINRNNRLRRLMDLQAPEVILRNEKRMLQEAVDAVLDNSSRRKPVKGAGLRPLKSLSDLLKGKRGRFRQNLLGKRVDYSGRSVIVVGPELKFHQCGLPKVMALELFKPFVVAKMVEMNGEGIKVATRQVEEKQEQVWGVLESVIQNHPVLLNRAPTLHRLGIQAFEPVLVEGLAIRLHPLACAAFNADFDGDQMAVHVPLSAEAQVETRMLILSTRNILRPASGEPIATPSQDMIIGVYYLTKPKSNVFGEGKIFRSVEEVRGAYDAGKIDLHARIKVKGITSLVEYDKEKNILGPNRWKHYTTVGQVIFNEIVTDELGFIKANSQTPHNDVFGKKGLTELVARCYNELGPVRTAVFLDNLKEIGFHYATTCGLTVGIDDMIIPSSKSRIIGKTKKALSEVENRARSGELTEAERYNTIIDLWTRAKEQVATEMFEKLANSKHGFNPIYMMAASGARGSNDQIQQLAGMRGLMAKPRKRLSGEVGETIETPIISSLKEGLSVLEYSISTHGSRKGLADTALKTADAGYLTRRLVDVAQDVVITMKDCGTVRGRTIFALKEGEEVIEPLRDRILGRVTAEDVYNPATEKILCETGQEIDDELSRKIEESGVESVRIRSVLTCEASHGLCAKCYGWDLSHLRGVTKGESVGVIAAQSIGEPGTQLTLRTFHIGGVAGHSTQETEVLARHSGSISFRNMRMVKCEYEGEMNGVIATRMGQLDILDNNGDVLSSYEIVVGSMMKVTDGQVVKKGDLICLQDPFTIPIVSEQSGSIHYVDIEEDITLQEELDSERRKQMMIVEDRSKTLHPHIFILPEHEIVVSGRPRRREEELHRLGELINGIKKKNNGKVIYTYKDASPARPSTIIEDIMEISSQFDKIHFLRIDCRKAVTGSYAALFSAAEEILGAPGMKTGSSAEKLKKLMEAIGNSSKKNETKEKEFVQVFMTLCKKQSIVLILSDLDRAHAGTKRLVKRIADNIEESRMILLASFSIRGRRSHVVLRGKQKDREHDPVEEFIHPRSWYAIPTGAHLRVHDADIISSGTHLARLEKKLGLQRDITGGLPRVDELFEARRPGDAAYIARISGIVSLSTIKAGLRTVTVRGEENQEEDIKIPATKHIRVHEDDRVEAGDRLTEGPIDPHDILEVKGTEAVEEYILNEVQEVYRLQGVKINDKHIGIICRQMLSKAKIEDPGDTRFLEGAQMDRLLLNKENMVALREGKRPASSKPILLGITKASLATDSFLSAASFQETNTVLADAAVAGKTDYLRGLKENVIVGHLIPSGTGIKEYNRIKLTETGGGALPEPPPFSRDIDEELINA